MKRDVLQLTRKQIVLHLEHLRVQNHNDRAFEAKLHGFKMNALPMAQKWNPEDDKRMSELAQKRFEELAKRAAEVKGS